MDSDSKLVKVKSISSSKVLNFVIDVQKNLGQVRKFLQDSDLKLSQFNFLMPDQSPIAIASQLLIKLSMILNEKSILFIAQPNKQLEKISELNADVHMQKKVSERSKKYEELLEKAECVKQKVQKFKVTFEQKINGLPQIDAAYQGEVNAFDQYEGIGLYKYANGETHKGEWKNGKRHGIGCYAFQNGTRYEGQYQSGVASGIGVEYLQEGNSMVAEYHNNKSNGLGIYYTPNGERFEGNFVNNIFQGQAYHIYPDGTWVAEYYKDGYLADAPPSQQAVQ